MYSKISTSELMGTEAPGVPEEPTFRIIGTNINFIELVTCGANRPEAVFVERESLVLSVQPHVLVEVAAAGEVQDHAVVLVMRTHPYVKVSECAFALLVALRLLQVAYTLKELFKDYTLKLKWLIQ